jgi:hypothetical protein
LFPNMVVFKTLAAEQHVAITAISNNRYLQDRHNFIPLRSTVDTELQDRLITQLKSKFQEVFNSIGLAEDTTKLDIKRLSERNELILEFTFSGKKLLIKLDSDIAMTLDAMPKSLLLKKLEFMFNGLGKYDGPSKQYRVDLTPFFQGRKNLMANLNLNLDRAIQKKDNFLCVDLNHFEHGKENDVLHNVGAILREIICLKLNNPPVSHHLTIKVSPFESDYSTFTLSFRSNDILTGSYNGRTINDFLTTINSVPVASAATPPRSTKRDASSSDGGSTAHRYMSVGMIPSNERTLGSPNTHFFSALTQHPSTPARNGSDVELGYDQV